MLKLGIGRVSSLVENFVSSSRILLKRVLIQGAKVPKLNKTLKKTYGRQGVLRQFSVNAKEFTDKLLV